MAPCPCGSSKELDACCALFISAEQDPPTAESLMRSRYTAYVQGDLDYLEQTLALGERDSFDYETSKEWSEQSEWLGLEVLSSTGGAANDREGVIEFVARFIRNGAEQEHHEKSLFLKTKGKWYFVGGRVIEPGAEDTNPLRIGRNLECPCGSGQKFKRCCGKK